MKMVNACPSLQKSNKKEFSIKNVFFTWGEWRKRPKESQRAENVFVSWLASAHI